MNSSFSLGNLIGGSWRIFKANWLFIILLFIAYQFLSQALGFLPMQLVGVFAVTKNIPLIFISIIIAVIFMVVISVWLQAGFYTVLLKLADGIKPKFTELFEQYRFIGLLFVNQLVFGLFVMGVALLVAAAVFIPGFVIGVLTNVDSIFLITMLVFLIGMLPLIPLFVLSYFTPFITVDKRIGPISNIKYALAFSKGKRIKMSLFAVAIGLFMIGGIFLLIIGIFITVPVGAIAFGRLYRSLSTTTPTTGYKLYLQGVKKASASTPKENSSLSAQEK